MTQTPSHQASLKWAWVQPCWSEGESTRFGAAGTECLCGAPFHITFLVVQDQNVKQEPMPAYALEPGGERLVQSTAFFAEMEE